jgi:hypothetical protein
VKENGRPNPDAACKPNPRDPPVTTATLPSSLKMLGKSFNWACAFASPRPSDMAGFQKLVGKQIQEMRAMTDEGWKKRELEVGIRTGIGNC